MGLDVSHDCWHGAYSAFMRWREQLARIAGVPLRLMEGFYDGINVGDLPGPSRYAVERVAEWLPVKWESLKPDVIHVLLNHSDCDGYIEPWLCGPLADRLCDIMDYLPEENDLGHIGNWHDTTYDFITGLRRAAKANERVEFR